MENYFLLPLAEYENKLQKMGLSALYGAEIEFYSHSTPTLVNMEFEKEKGEGQYEFQLPPVPSASELARQIKAGKEALSNVNFAAKPFPQQPGSALHIHINLLAPNGDNLYRKKNEQEESDLMLWSLGGLCYSMPYMLPYFAPFPEDYARFTPGHDAPINVSWGGDNRTTALRLPVSGPSRRIEHRVSSAAADPEQVLSAILIGIIIGIENKIQPPARIFGIAYDKQYHLPPLPSTLQEAISLWKNIPSNLAEFMCKK